MDIKSFIVDSLGIETSDIDLVVPYFERVSYEKNEFLLDSGDVCEYIYYLTSGCVLNRIEGNNAEPVLKEIITTNMWFSDLKSFEAVQPSEQFLESITAVSVYRLSRANFDLLESNFPNFSKVARKVMTEVNRHLEARILRLKQMDAQERWDWFRQEPRFQSLTLSKKVISEYLDMRPETLSRLIENRQN
jgi:CRP-like cAMP-binding protein